MTITEKILARHAGRKTVEPGEFILADVDLSLGNDITAPIAIKEFRKAGGLKVFDRSKVVLVADHFTPNKDINSAEQVKMLWDFSVEQNLKNRFGQGEVGVEHALLPEQGLVFPGDLVIGADSHTCTYGALGAFSTGVGSSDLAFTMLTGKAWFKVPEALKFVFSGKPGKWVSGKDLILHVIGHIGVDGALYKSMEFAGAAIRALDMSDRLAMCNMAIEAGAKNGIVEPDEKALAFVKRASRHGRRKLSPAALKGFAGLKSDEDARYSNVFDIDVSGIEPVVAFPHLPSNTRPVSKAGKIKLDQSVIGSCTNGRIEDLRVAAKVLKGRKVPEGMKLIIIPATPEIYAQALKEGLFDIFLKAGGIISPPTCGPCLGGHMGILAKGERAISSTNRNFVGRMGALGSEVYLANPAVCAASAILGRIASPEEL
jgi:3-isopropylmalate/(R)-2-methylmalate dehydratase large subunit